MSEVVGAPDFRPACCIHATPAERSAACLFRKAAPARRLSRQSSRCYVQAPPRRRRAASAAPARRSDRWHFGRSDTVGGRDPSRGACRDTDASRPSVGAADDGVVLARRSPSDRAVGRDRRREVDVPLDARVLSPAAGRRAAAVRAARATPSPRSGSRARCGRHARRRHRRARRRRARRASSASSSTTCPPAPPPASTRPPPPVAVPRRARRVGRARRRVRRDAARPTLLDAMLDATGIILLVDPGHRAARGRDRVLHVVLPGTLGALVLRLNARVGGRARPAPRRREPAAHSGRDLPHEGRRARDAARRREPPRASSARSSATAAGLLETFLTTHTVIAISALGRALERRDGRDVLVGEPQPWNALRPLRWVLERRALPPLRAVDATPCRSRPTCTPPRPIEVAARDAPGGARMTTTPAVHERAAVTPRRGAPAVRRRRARRVRPRRRSVRRRRAHAEPHARGGARRSVARSASATRRRRSTTRCRSSTCRGGGSSARATRRSHDARGRLALVSDSVAVDAASFRALRADPFRCVPRRQDAARRRRRRALDVPRFTAEHARRRGRRGSPRRAARSTSARAAPAARRAARRRARARGSRREPLAPALLQASCCCCRRRCGGSMTFQTAATRAPRARAAPHRRRPPLRGARRRCAWTRELPREARVVDARADAAADALLALRADALAAAHALYEELAGDDAHAAARCSPRSSASRATARSRAALRGAPRPLRCAPPRGARRPPSCDALTAHRRSTRFPPTRVGARARRAARRARAPRRTAAGARLDRASCCAREQRASGGSRRRPRRARSTRRSPGATACAGRPTPRRARARAALAIVAARRGDAERLVQLADVDAPWSELSRCPTRRAPTPAARLTSTVVAALAHARAGDADAGGRRARRDRRALAARSRATAAARRGGARARRRVARSRGVRRRPSRPSRGVGAERLRRVADALVAFWERVGAVRRARRGAARAARAGARATPPMPARSPRSSAPCRRSSAPGGSARRRSAPSPPAATSRRSRAVRRRAARRRARRGARARRAAARRGAATARRSAARGPRCSRTWTRTRGATLLVRALARSTAGDVALDELAATCGALADLDFRLDGAAARDIAPSLARWAATLPATRAGAMRLGAALALLGELADADAAARARRRRAARRRAETLRALVQLRRLATAAHEVEGDARPGRVGRAARRAAPRATDDLLPAQRAALRAFLGVHRRRARAACSALWE